MDKLIKNIIDEAFSDKNQPKLIFSKINNKSIKPKKTKTIKKQPKEVDEIVDAEGNFRRGSKPGDIATKGVTSKSTSDKFARATMPQMGSFGVAGGTNTSRGLRYWTESDMSKALGYEDTLGKDEELPKAKKYFKKVLKLDDDETEERLEKMGYDEELPDDKVRLIENPNKFIEEYLESILPKKSKQNDVLEKSNDEPKKVNPIIKRQINVIKKTLKNNGLTINNLIDYLKNE